MTLGHDRVSRARVAITVVFLAQGLLFASWAAHIPLVKSRLQLSDATLGTGLLGAPAGSVIGLLVAGWLLPRVGSATMTRLLLIGYAGLGVFVGLSRSLPQLFLTLAAWGLCQGSLGVAMNTQAVAVERAVRRPIMAGLHGSWSVGGLIGAGVGAGTVALGVDLTPQLIVLGAPVLVVSQVVCAWLLPEQGPGTLPAAAARPPAAESLARPSVGSSPSSPMRLALPTLLVLGAVNCIGMVGQGSAADWSAVYVRDSVAGAAAIAAVPYAVYSLTIVVVRLGSPVLLRRLPARRLLPLLSTVAVLGMAAALLAHSVVAATIGFATLAAGVGLVVPTCVTLAGRVPGVPTARAVAVVSGTGWIGFMLGPPVIGHLASVTSLRLALALIPLLLGVSTVVLARATVFHQAGLQAHYGQDDPGTAASTR